MRWVWLIMVPAGLLFLWKSRTEADVVSGVNGVTESARMGLDARWRSLPEREMTVGEMERYAARLGDEELLEEMARCRVDWMRENEGRKWFFQPRLAVMLAREVGRRKGEAGMMEVAGWLRGVEKKDAELQNWGLGQTRWGFFEPRVRLAGYAGWVSVEPSKAISRLIESRKNEEDDWPVVNEGFLFNLKFPEFFAMEEVLRDGFEQLSEADLGRARELVIKGASVWAFDLDQVLDGLMQRMSGDERSEFFGRKVRSGKVLAKDPFGEVGNLSDEEVALARLADLVEPGIWVGEDVDSLLGEVQFGEGKLDVLARVRPEVARLVLDSGELGGTEKIKLTAWLGYQDHGNYSLISTLDGLNKLVWVDHMLRFSQGVDFGPITGRENPRALDLGRLKEVVEKTEMGGEVRGRIEELLVEWEMGVER